MYYFPPDSSVRGISQERILESVSISFSRDLPDPGMKPVSPALAGRLFTNDQGSQDSDSFTSNSGPILWHFGQ